MLDYEWCGDNDKDGDDCYGAGGNDSVDDDDDDDDDDVYSLVRYGLRFWLGLALWL